MKDEDNIMTEAPQANTAQAKAEQSTVQPAPQAKTGQTQTGAKKVVGVHTAALQRNSFDQNQFRFGLESFFSNTAAIGGGAIGATGGILLADALELRTMDETFDLAGESGTSLIDIIKDTIDGGLQDIPELALPLAAIALVGSALGITVFKGITDEIFAHQSDAARAEVDKLTEQQKQAFGQIAQVLQQNQMAMQQFAQLVEANFVKLSGKIDGVEARVGEVEKSHGITPTPKEMTQQEQVAEQIIGDAQQQAMEQQQMIEALMKQQVEKSEEPPTKRRPGVAVNVNNAVQQAPSVNHALAV
jgi:hypothetical protein